MHFLDKIKKFYKYAILINFLLLAFIIYQVFYSKYYWPGNDEKRITIEQGQNSDEIISALKSDSIISNPFLFKIALKLSGKEGQLIASSFLLKNGMSNSELISIITDKNNIQVVRITIPPGYSIKQISKLAEKKLNHSRDKFVKEASNDSLIQLLGLKDKIKNLEGFLFPDSYDVSPAISEKKFVLLLFNEFRKRVLDNAEIKTEIEREQTTLLKTITLASIIDGETLIEVEKPVIAGVYLNRIKKNMRLEADPTVQFIIPDGPRRLLYDDLKINSPYNTYLNKGLPPGPINNPGLSSIRAALNPADHNYIFFVATGEGGHKFTENYQQHLEAIKEYKARLRQKKNQ